MTFDNQLGKISGSEMILVVADVVATVPFYGAVPEFTDEWLRGEPPTSRIPSGSRRD